MHFFLLAPATKANQIRKAPVNYCELRVKIHEDKIDNALLSKVYSATPQRPAHVFGSFSNSWWIIYASRYARLKRENSEAGPLFPRSTRQKSSPEQKQQNRCEA